MKRLLLGSFLLWFASMSHAVICVVKIKKASCWNKYNVNVTVKSRKANDKRMVFLTKDKSNKPSVHQKDVLLRCEPGDSLSYSAKFNPPIWDDQKGDSVVYAKQRVAIPTGLSKKHKVAISICFPEDYKNAPFPYEYSEDCACPVSKLAEKKKKR